MEYPVERFKLPQTAKDQLTKLKRQTGIDRWNVLCRWAFCRSLAEESSPSPVPVSSDSNVEMSWRVFGGEMADALAIALKQRCYHDGLGVDRDTLAQQFALHLNRGIGYLASDRDLQEIEDWLRLLDDAPQTSPQKQ
ncbi:DNA sulfur modification protein DndE [Baaleninema sp.]|uniref:DNA sulfur modification protein DndE n=1 Tax=Baaleninema sp. TaxID=3101197 RepID=UPI003CFF22B8